MYSENYVKFCDLSLSSRHTIEPWVVLFKEKENR